jgi:hypothetical protein
MSARPFDFESTSQSTEISRLNIRARNEAYFPTVGALLKDRREHHAIEIIQQTASTRSCAGHDQG